MRRLTHYFLNGLLFLIPVVATVYILYMVFKKVDNLFDFNIPGMGVLTTFGLVTLIGFIASTFILNKIVGLVDGIFRRLPLVKMIYTSIKDLISAFVGDKKSFNKPVLVRLSEGSTASAIGFITQENMSRLGLEGKVAVYLPQSYNFAGNLIVVDREMVEPLKLDSGQVMAFIVSGGVSTS